jgi:hypothetical protein
MFRIVVVAALADALPGGTGALAPAKDSLMLDVRLESACRPPA